MFFNKGFISFHFCWVEQVDFGDFGDKVQTKFDGMVIGAVRRVLVMDLFRKDICKVIAPLVMQDDGLMSSSMILTLREVLTKRHCVLKIRLK